MDLRSADLPLLVSLEALVSAQSVTGAARRLGLSQPAMSAQLARLRDIFGDPLLVGNARGMVPTRRAEELVAQLRGPLGDIARVLREGVGFDPVRSDATIRIVGSEHTNSVIGVPLLARLGKSAPNMRLALYAYQASAGVRQFVDRDMDLGLLTPSMELPGMERAPLFDDDLVIAQRKGGRGGMALDDYLNERHILVSTSGGSFSAGVDEALATKGLTRNVVVSVQSFSVALGMVMTTDLLTTLPRHYAARWADFIDISELPLDVPAFAFHMVWPRRVDADPMHRWLRGEVRAVAAEVAV
ncbi:MAG: LysR family transcriptional regulator [Hyphomicrobiaceae bacterium]|nr:LysR family transcriptional regulator [Hyphomicrobiaceae bacterium]MCC0023291.1 LysR family transcriptional regulator [Hyphomicrobiaceae bacterium]